VVEYDDQVVPLSQENAYWKPAVTSGADGSVTLVAEVNGVGPSATDVGAVTPVTVGASRSLAPSLIAFGTILVFAFTATLTVAGPTAAHEPEFALNAVQVPPLSQENA
jgi:hypothetical protein